MEIFQDINRVRGPGNDANEVYLNATATPCCGGDVKTPRGRIFLHSHTSSVNRIYVYQSALLSEFATGLRCHKLIT